MHMAEQMAGDVIKEEFNVSEVGFLNQNKPECTVDLSSPPLFARVTRLGG